jgi:hypothetical protein
VKCPECGRHITPRSKFCPYCGKAATPRRSSKPSVQTTKPNWPLYLALVLGGIAIGVFAFRGLQTQNPAPAAATASFDPTLRGDELAKLYPAVYEVASQFNCPCDDCNDGIEICDCVMERGAAEVRQFIYDMLQIHKPPHAIEMVAEKYGNRKNGATVPFHFEHAPSPTWQAPGKP